MAFIIIGTSLRECNVGYANFFATKIKGFHTVR